MAQLTVELEDRELQQLRTNNDLWRAKRLAAIMSMHGIWKDDPTKPQDGAEYQREIRAEWR